MMITTRERLGTIDSTCYNIDVQYDAENIPRSPPYTQTSLSMVGSLRHRVYTLSRSRLLLVTAIWICVTLFSLDFHIRKEHFLQRIGGWSRELTSNYSVQVEPASKVTDASFDTTTTPDTSYHDDNGTDSLVSGFHDDEYPPCGEVCQYSGKNADSINKHYKELTKRINCDNIMKRMAYKNHKIQYPPPENPPDDQLDEFTQSGDMPIKLPMYMVDFNPDTQATNGSFSRQEMLNLIKMAKEGFNINGYDDKGCMMNTLKSHKAKYSKTHGVVIGTQTPWLEAMLLAFEAGKLTTLEYTPLTLDHPKLEVYDPYTYAQMYLDNKISQFDFGATFSSLEHSGLGRYGDPLNPYGDFEAMAQVYCLTKPGGIFFLGIPGSYDGSSYLRWNAQRMYGPARLQYLTANWKLVEYVRCKDEHIVLVLKRR